jgi:ABC-type transport system involved in cytochrome c biogenesis permease component
VLKVIILLKVRLALAIEGKILQLIIIYLVAQILIIDVIIIVMNANINQITALVVTVVFD